MSKSMDDVVDMVAARIKERLISGNNPKSTPAAPAGGGGGAKPSLKPSLPKGGGAKPVSKATAPGAGGSSWKRPGQTVEKPWLKGRYGSAPKAAAGDPSLARYIDHTLLKADAPRAQIEKLCREARENGFFSVCVNSVNVATAAELLRGASSVVCAVVGFPLGAMSPASKAFETSEAVRAGAGEIDMVLNIGAIKSKDYSLVLEDIQAVVQAAKPARVKVILETSQLNEEEKVIACALSKIAGAAFVKTSTGFGGGGATVPDVKLMKRIVGDGVEVKASGAVRTQQDAQNMIAAGATRIGASSSVAIVTGDASGGGSGY